MDGDVHVSGGEAHMNCRRTDGLQHARTRRVAFVVAVAVLAAVIALAPAGATAAAGALTSGNYSGPEGAVHYQLYVPSSYSPTTPVPLVVALHGCTQTADGF